MTGKLLELIAKALDSNEREALLGDIAESGESGWRAFSGIAGLIARRQTARWQGPWPWITLLGVVPPLGYLGGRICARASSITAIYSWLYLNNWSPLHLQSPGFRSDLRQAAQTVFVANLCLILFASIAGLLIKRLSKEAAWINAAMFCLIVPIGEMMSPHHVSNNSAVFARPVYRAAYPLIASAAFVMLPVIIAMRFKIASRAARIITVLAIAACMTYAADKTPAVKLTPAAERKPAPEFTLSDSDGKPAQLKQYRGKVVLLDFWATWCHGCKEEIPWFAEYQKTYGIERVAVIGASMDEGGWKVLKPFLETNRVPYRMVLADDQLARQYGIAALPDTFIIDRKGRIAAAYRARLIDRGDVSHKIEELLNEP